MKRFLLIALALVAACKQDYAPPAEGATTKPETRQYSLTDPEWVAEADARAEANFYGPDFDKLLDIPVVIFDGDGTKLCCLDIRAIHLQYEQGGYESKVRRTSNGVTMTIRDVEDSNKWAVLTLAFVGTDAGMRLMQISGDGEVYAKPGGPYGYANSEEYLRENFELTPVPVDPQVNIRHEKYLADEKACKDYMMAHMSSIESESVGCPQLPTTKNPNYQPKE